eukprot:SAG22_NODE_65_length_23128_cov_51.766609_7_plen_173_part_00
MLAQTLAAAVDLHPRTTLSVTLRRRARRPGNHILMGLQNIIANPKVGICIEIPGNPTTLRLGGKASLLDDPELLQRLATRGLDATLAIKVEVEYCFFHCAKAYLRSRLWDPTSWSQETYEVGFGRYGTEDEAAAAEIDAGTAAGYARMQAAVDGSAPERAGIPRRPSRGQAS